MQDTPVQGTKALRINLEEKPGHNSETKEPCNQQQSTSYRNLKSLHNMALKIVSSGDVPKPVIAVGIARIKYTLDYPTWITKFTTPSEIFINHRNETFKCFSFPEYSEKRNQIEACTFDPTHLMTNLRAHACRKGFKFLIMNHLSMCLM